MAAWNSHGRGFSEISRAVTKQDVPQGVSPPKWAKVDNREDMILLNWEEPLQPNGTVICSGKKKKNRNIFYHYIDSVPKSQNVV